MICSRANEMWPGLADCDAEKTVLDLKRFLAESQPVKVELIRRSLTNIGCGERDLTQGHYEGILQLAEQNVTGRKIELPGGFVVWREYGNLIFSNCRVGLAPPISSIDQAVTVEIPGQTTFEKYLIQAIVLERNEVDFEKFKAAKTDSIEWFDLDKTKLPLTVRKRRPGDRFVPLGQIAEKKIGKFLSAQRIPYPVRREVFVIEDREKIIWIWPVRISEQTRITSNTRKILQLEVTGLTG